MTDTSIAEWMRDNDYLLVEIDGENVWVDLDDNIVNPTDVIDKEHPAIRDAALMSPEVLAEAAANTQSLIDSGDYEVYDYD